MKKQSFCCLYRFLTPALLLGMLANLGICAWADEGHDCEGLHFDRQLEGELPATLEPGNYYMTGECKAVRHVDIYGEVNICLNGCRAETEGATTFHPRDGGVLSVYDCGGQGVIGYTGGTYNNHPVTVDTGGTINVFGGHLYARTNSNCINSEGTVNIYGGLVESCTAGYCGIRNFGALTVYGGEITGYDGIMQRQGGIIRLAGNSFVISGSHEAISYLDDPESLVVETPLYLWRTDPEGEFTSSEEQPFKYIQGTSYIEFAPLTGDITLDLNGGSCQETLSGYICGETTALPANPEKEGYRFTGWYVHEDSAAGPVFEITADARGNLFYVAGWEKIETEPEPPLAQTAAMETDSEEEQGLNRFEKTAIYALPVIAAIVCIVIFFNKKK